VLDSACPEAVHDNIAPPQRGVLTLEAEARQHKAPPKEERKQPKDGERNAHRG